MNKFLTMVNDVKAVWAALAILGCGAVWASDMYHDNMHKDFLRVSVYNASELKKEVKDLVNVIADLEDELEEENKRSTRQKLNRKKAQLINLRAEQ